MPQNSGLPLFNSFSSENLSFTYLSSVLYQQYDVHVVIARLDRIHPQISGNKWFKLKPHLERVLSRKGDVPLLVSFGGAHSNHLHALAYAGWRLGIKTLGVVRGDSHASLSPTLQDAQRWGMKLKFVSRQDYRLKTQHSFLQNLRDELGESIYVLPEGGASELSRKSCAEIVPRILEYYPQTDFLACPVGTGNTLSGLAAGVVGTGLHCLGFCALRNESEIEIQLAAASINPSSYTLVPEAAGRGYAKVHNELAAFLALTEQKNHLVLDPVYTGKMLLAFNRMLVAGYFSAGAHIVLLHTGGLQGIRGMQSELERRRTAFVGPLLC